MVNDPRDLFDDPQLQHRRHFQWLDHPEIGPYATDRSEFDLSLTPGSLDTPAPLLGQHTEHFLRDDNRPERGRVPLAGKRRRAGVACAVCPQKKPRAKMVSSGSSKTSRLI